jgi:hypothetical protein
MSGGLPTERQLDALQRRVLARIRRRAAVRARVASAAGGVALVAGLLVLVHPTLGPLSSGTASGAGGSTADRGAPTAGVLCHATSEAGSPVRKVPLPDRATTASIAAACAAQAASRPAYGTGSSASPASSNPPSSLVVCRDPAGRWQVFPGDGRPSTLCTRNGLRRG